MTGNTGKGIKFNTFLCSKHSYEDFDVAFKVRPKGKRLTAAFNCEEETDYRGPRTGSTSAGRRRTSRMTFGAAWSARTSAPESCGRRPRSW